jgi:hypothetical protein
MQGPTEVLAVVPSRMEAELIVGMLRSHGVDAEYRADDAGGQEPQLQMLGVTVFVAASDEPQARQILATTVDNQEQC